MHVAYKENRFQYMCQNASSKYAKANCQYLTGLPIDEAVVQEFFRVLQPAEIDALERVDAKQAEHRRELEQHLEQEVRRLEYAATRAERQYDSVDPENRLIASTLEKRWEDALAELEQSRARLAELKARGPQPVAIPAELRGLRRRRPPVAGVVGTAPGRVAKDLAPGAGGGRQPESRRDRCGSDQDRVAWRPGQ